MPVILSLHDQPSSGSSRPAHRARALLGHWAGQARRVALLLAGLALIQLSGCAGRLWPPSEWQLQLDLPFVRTTTDTAAPAPAAGLKDPANAAEALAYAEALCTLPPAELQAEIERLQTLQNQQRPDPLRAQQLAFAQQLAQLYAEQERLLESNERQAQQLRERQRRIDQLSGQIEAMRAVEYSLPAASPTAVPTPAATVSPVPDVPPPAPAPAAAPQAGRTGSQGAAPSPKAVSPNKPAQGSDEKSSKNGKGGDSSGADPAGPKVGEDTHPPLPTSP
jgi:multidrug efflux pump subunit AcrA (membrane-fusion protein)